MRKIWPFGIVAVALISAAFWVWTSRSAPITHRTGPLQKLTLAHVPAYSILNLIAQQQGYFTQQGLEVQLDAYDSGATTVGALLEGKADIALASSFAGVSASFENSDLRILAITSKSDVFRVVARRDAGISQPSDLKGKTIAMTKRTAGEFHLGRFLAANRLPPSQVTLVNISPADAYSRLIAGTLDASIAFEPTPYQMEEALGRQAISWPVGGEASTREVLYTLNHVIERHPDTLAGYIRALAQAETYLRSHQPEARSLLASAMQKDDAYVNYFWQKFQFGLGLPQDLLLGMEAEARWFIENRLTTKTQVPNYLGTIYFLPLEEVNPAAITIVH